MTQPQDAAKSFEEKATEGAEEVKILIAYIGAGLIILYVLALLGITFYKYPLMLGLFIVIPMCMAFTVWCFLTLLDYYE